MPELPSVTVYVEHLRRRTVDRTLQRIRIANPFVLRSYEPPIGAAHGARVQAVERLGKRIVFSLSGDLFLVIHLMVAGRLRWQDGGAAAKIPRKVGLAGFQFDSGTLVLTEAGSKRRASVHLAAGSEGLAEHERGGLEILEADAAEFREALLRENHTLKRALADPRLFSGIGNAFSDEILHRAGLSPLQLTARMTGEQVDTLHGACVAVLTEWVDLLRAESGEEFPKKVTAFHPKMGRARQVRAAVPGVRHGGAAHRVRRQREQLLPALPDWRQAARRPRPVPPAQVRLAAQRRGTGRPPQAPPLTKERPGKIDGDCSRAPARERRPPVRAGTAPVSYRSDPPGHTIVPTSTAAPRSRPGTREDLLPGPKCRPARGARVSILIVFRATE